MSPLESVVYSSQNFKGTKGICKRMLAVTVILRLLAPLFAYEAEESRSRFLFSLNPREQENFTDDAFDET